MLAFTRPTTLPVANTTSPADVISRLCLAFEGNCNRVSLLREAINHVNDSEGFRRELTEHFVPILVSSNLETVDESEMMAVRYSVMLCNKLVARSTCDALVSIRDFIPFIHKAMSNKHTCISRLATDAIIRLVAYAPAPETVLWSKDIDVQVLTQVAVNNLSSVNDGNRCLDAIRVLTLLSNSSRLSLIRPLQLCEHMVETFYNTPTPFVSKQTAGLIILFADQDDLMKEAVVRLLREKADENKPTKASRCWQEVNDVMAFVSN